jgi:hypothetical protein
MKPASADFTCEAVPAAAGYCSSYEPSFVKSFDG